MKQKTIVILSSFLCILLTFFVSSATIAATESKLVWNLKTTTKEEQLLLEVTGNSLPEYTTGIELKFMFPLGTQMKDITPQFINDDKTTPEYYFKQSSDGQSIIVTVYCVNKFYHSFPNEQPLFTLSLINNEKLSTSNLKIVYAKLVDSALQSTLYETNTFELVEDSNNTTPPSEEDTSNNTPSGGGSFGGSEPFNKEPNPEQKEDKEDKIEEEITASTKKTTNKKTGTIKHTITLSDKKTNTQFITEVVYDKSGNLIKQQSSYYPSEADITTSKNKITISAKIPDTEWFKALEMTKKEYGLTEDSPIKLILPTSIISQMLKEGKEDNISVKIVIPSWIQEENNMTLNGIILEKSVLNTAKQRKKSIQISIKGEEKEDSYTWLFSKEAVKKSQTAQKTLNLLVKKKSDTKKLFLNFYETQPLSIQARLTLYLDSSKGFEADKNAYLYGYNSKTKKLLALTKEDGYMIKKNNQVTLNLTGIRDYVIYPKKAKIVTPLLSQVSIAKKTTLSSEKSNSKLNITVPDCLILTQKKGAAKLPGSAYKEAVISYQSSNPDITVNKNGKVTAKNSGTATIRTTITLSDQTVKTFQTKVTATVN